MSKRKVAIYDCCFDDKEKNGHEYHEFITAFEKEISSCPEYELVGTYIDVCGYATRLHERPEYKKVVEKVEKSGIDVLSCISMKSMGVRLTETMAAVHTLMDNGVSVKHGREIFDSSKIEE